MKFTTSDFEAYQWTKFKTAGHYDGENFTYFTDIDDYLDHALQRKYRGYRIFFHYGGNYDFKFFLENLCRRAKSIHIMDTGSRILQIKLSLNGKNNYYFVDSYSILPMAQAKLAKAFGVEHQKKEIDFSKLKEKDYYSQDMFDRLKNDTIGLYEIINKFKDWGLHNGTLKLTLSMQSLDTFKKKFLTETLNVLNESDEEFIRSCYYGGWTDVFKFYGEDLYYYDYNSLYPYEMTKEMPCGDFIKTDRYRADKIGFYQIKVDMDSHIPFLPSIIDKKLYFLNGTITANVSTAEIDMLNELKIPFTIIKGGYFTEKKYLFKDFINEMYKIRIKSKKGSMDNLIAKLIMNGLYGKFGQRREREEILFQPDFDIVKKKNLIPYYEELDLYKKKTKSKSRFILPYLSAYITSLARMDLYRAFLKVGLNNVWYCDTDSIITNKKLKTSNKLGKLKLEHKIKKAVFLQPKCYALITDDNKEIIKIKGFKEHTLKVIDFITALNNNDLSNMKTSYYKINGYKEQLKRNNSLKIHRELLNKKLKTFYEKRKRQGNDTVPFNINELTK